MQEILKILIPIAVTHAIVLVAVVVVIRKMLLNETVQAVQRIQQVEAEVRKKEETIRKEIEEHEQEFTRKKTEAEGALQKQKEQSEKDVARMRDQVLSDAKKESDRILDGAKKNEEKLRKQILQDMEEKSIDYAIKVLQLVFSEKINQDLNRAFIDELLDALQDVDSSSITVDGKDAQFSTSHPMLPEQKERLQKLLADKFNVQVQVAETIRPELLAGLVFKLGSLEIDGSLSNRLREAAAEMKKNGTT